MDHSEIETLDKQVENVWASLRRYFELTQAEQNKLKKQVIMPEPIIPKDKMCLMCSGEGVVEHECDCELCYEHEEECLECGGSGRHE